MTLGELIDYLAKHDPDRVVADGFGNPHSYRGDYFDLAFEPIENTTVGAMLAAARSALGATFQGWKGGDFTMDEYTTVWLSREGCADEETITPRLLGYMIGTRREEQP